MKLIILRGVSGSGKSTTADFFCESIPGCVSVSADDYMTDSSGVYRFDHNKLDMAHRMCYIAVERSMKHGYVVVLHNTSTRESEFQKYIDLAAKMNYDVISLIVENRHGNENIHGVPVETIKKQSERFEIKLTNLGPLELEKIHRTQKRIKV